MEIGNEKQNKATNQSAGLGTKRQGQWRAVCGPDQRFYFVNLDNDVSQWVPPVDLWSSKFGFPYGWEAGVTNNNIKYYINHVNKISTLEDPRSEAERASTKLQMAAARARKVQIKRDPSLGFGFVAGSEKPVVIRSVISGGPSHGKLFANDQILRVNGEDVSEVPQERVINLIKACTSLLEINVVSSEDLQDAKNQGQRRSSLMSRATRERRKSSPVNVRFAEDMVQFIGPAEQARRASLPALPNVLKVFLENGQTRSFHFNPKTTVQEIFSALGPKLDIKAMEYFCLVLSGPQKNQLSFLQNHEKVSEIYLNRNCSRSSWVCKLRICFIPRDPNELLEKDPVAFDYLYDQISKDIVEGLFEIDLRYDLAIKLAALHMQQKATEAKNKMPTKISVKSVEKDFDGLEHFLPENIINGVKLKDLRKVLEQQIKFNQSLAGLGQRYLTSKECKKEYLKLASELVSYGGKYFNVILYANEGGTASDVNTKSRKARHQEATVLVSPKYGLSQMVKGKINVLCQLAELEQVSEFSISFHNEGKRLLTIKMADNKDLVLLMKPLDSMDLVTFIVGYQKLWNCTTAKLTIIGERQEPLAPLTDHDVPMYASLHRVIPDTWSYPSFLQVPGSHYDHYFYLDLTKDPPKYMPSKARSVNGPVHDISSEDIDSNHIAAKRSSEDEEVVSTEAVPGKRIKVDNDSEQAFEFENGTQIVDSPDKTRTLYSIAEESQISNNEDQETDEDDYISQLTMAEEIWRRNRNEKMEISLKTSTAENEKESQDADAGSSKDANPDEILDSQIENEKDGDGMIVDDKESDEENEPLNKELEKNSSEEENSEIKDISREEESKQKGRHDFSKKDHVKVDEFEQRKSDELLDINDIDFDDNSGTPMNDSLDLLADFSFTGDIIPQENGSPVDVKNGDVFKHGDKLKHDDDTDVEDDYDEHDDHDDRHEELSNVDRDSPDGVNIAPANKPNEEMKVPKSSQADRSTSGNNTFDSLSSNKIFFLDKKGNFGDSGESDFDDKDDGKIKNLDENEVDEDGIQLLSYKQREDQDGPVVGRTVVSSEREPFIEELSGHGCSVEEDNRLEAKDSDLSSLSSQGSLHLTNTVDGGRTFQESRDVNKEQSYDMIAKSSSSDEVDSLDGSTDAGMRKNLVNAQKKATDDNAVQLSSKRYHNEVDLLEKPDDPLPGGIDQHDNQDNKRKTLNSTEKENDVSEVSKMDERLENTVDATTKDLKDEGKSSPLVLILGNDPGESEDTLESFQSSSETTEPVLTKEEIDFQEFSLMDWIIPPPPGSTEELLDGDISVASPPPVSPTFEFISSPPVELNDNFFNESEIDDMILPPPPMGSSFSSVIRIVSPPPTPVKDSTRKERPKSNGKHNENFISDVESNIQQLGNLKLEDARNVLEDEFVPVTAFVQSRSSESSSSVFTDDYTSMVSCYSLSNDSQRTSEDESFDEERNEIEVFREIQDQSAANVTLFKLLEPGMTNRKFEDVGANSQEGTSSAIELSQPAETVYMEVQQGRADNPKRSIIDEERISAQHKSNDNDDLDALDQIYQGTDIPRNGLPYENDYDCLDEVLFTEGNDTLANEGFQPGTHRTASLSTQKNDRQVEETKTINGPSEISRKFEKPSLEEDYAGKSATDVGYVKNRAKLFERQENPADTKRMKNNSPTINSPKIKDNGSMQKHTVNDSNSDKSITRRNANLTNPKRLLDPPVSRQRNISQFLPGYQLKVECHEVPPVEAERKPSSSDWSSDFESETATDEDPSPRFRRKLPGKRTMNKIPAKQHRDMALDYGQLDVSSSDESVKIDGAGAIDKHFLDDSNDEVDIDDETSLLKRSCRSAKNEASDVTEMLKVRLQGCVDDCQNSALKSSYLPYANSNKWKEGVHENAVFLGSEIKLLNNNVQEMNNDIPTSMKTSLESLQSLVSSFVLASTSHQRISLYSVRMLAGILNDVISLYDEVIAKIEEAVRSYPDKSGLQSVAEKTSSMTALVASLRRTLKKL